MDKDGRLTSDEFVIAMHCCDVVRVGQTLPKRVPDEWLQGSNAPRERTGSLSRANGFQAFASFNQELKEAFAFPAPVEQQQQPQPSEHAELERKNSLVTYEEKRQKNYEVRTSILYVCVDGFACASFAGWS